MVLGEKLNEFKDESGKIAVSVWQAESDVATSINKVEVEVGPEWVCIGGGGRGSEEPGQFLTASYPIGPWKGWSVATKDHLTPDPNVITGWAIGMKIDGLSRDELISNLFIGSSLSPPQSHNDHTLTINNQEFKVLGGGFKVGIGTQQPDMGNFATGSFPDSSFGWRARSKDMVIITPLPIAVHVIGIKQTLLKPNPKDPTKPTIFGRIDITFDSAETLPSAQHPVSTAKLFPGYVLCGGGALANQLYWIRGSYLWALEPVTERTENPTKQSFTGRSKDHYWEEYCTITAFAMGIKFIAPEIDL
jgi:hypothetical protein